MARCRRCGTIYNDGARYCPKCGEPERAERGLFRAPRPDSSPGGENDEGTRKRSGGIFAVPLPFAVLVVGILMNPAVPQWIFKIYLHASAALGLDASSPSRAAMSYAPSLCGMCAACAVLASSTRRHRGSRLLRFAAVVIFMLTLISLVSTLTNSLKYISLPGAF